MCWIFERSQGEEQFLVDTTDAGGHAEDQDRFSNPAVDGFQAAADPERRTGKQKASQAEGPLPSSMVTGEEGDDYNTSNHQTPCICHSEQWGMFNKVSICTWTANSTTAEMPTQLWMEYRWGTWMNLWKSNTAHRPRTESTRARNISPACTSFQTRFFWLQVNGSRYTTAAADTQKTWIPLHTRKCFRISSLCRHSLRWCYIKSVHFLFITSHVVSLFHYPKSISLVSSVLKTT